MEALLVVVVVVVVVVVFVELVENLIKFSTNP
jgi:hypothetical protein